MNVESLTAEQERFANHSAEAFMKACPGAGKTRTIVARLLKIATKLPPRRGIAILSFTNSAVEEFTRRCRQAGAERFLRFPNFVGTLDGFVRQFLILPFGITGSKSRPIIVDSWRSLGIEIRLFGERAFPGDGVSLDRFDPETNAIVPDQIGHTALRDHVRKNQAAYEQAAAARRKGLCRAGYLSANDARFQASSHIRDPAWNHALGTALAARFDEIIVDEAQDCNPLDLELLKWLRSRGLRVTVVCDPDQAIYGFRDGKPSDLAAFAGQYREADRLALKGNFRSSGPICALAATLRGRDDPDNPVGEAATVTHPVILLTFPGKKVVPDIGRLFIERIQATYIGLSPSQCILLSHRHRDAQRAVGDPMSEDLSGTSRLEALARATSEFWSPSATSRSRETALRTVERLLLEFMGEWQEEDHHPSRVVARVGLDGRKLRRQALEIIMRLPSKCSDADKDRRAWVTSVHSEVTRLGLAPQSGKSAQAHFRCPPNGNWSRHLHPPPLKTLACSTIHEAKGKEYEAVCVVLHPDHAPDKHTSELLGSWRQRTDLEAKRVIYVGVTRAKRLVMLAVPDVFAGECRSILDQGKVPYEVENISKGAI
jgi:DNA helicase-2/ATP-dependent DNA helicase PcrA